MSDQDPEPQERICAAGAAPAGIEVLEPRAVPLGGVRAMTVRRTLPQRQRSLIGAWCFLDHYGPDAVDTTGGMNVPAHPHTGLQTASWLFTGEIEHRDSSGAHAMVRPGELNLMTAGSGISHSERSTPDTSILHGAQLWIALPEAARHVERRFDHYVPPVRTGEGWRASVFLGTLLGETSPVPTHTPLIGAEITLDPGSAIDLAVDPAHEHGVLVDQGDVRLSRGIADGAAEGSDAAADPGQPVEAHELGFSPAGEAVLRLRAGASGARVLLIGGEPFAERIVMWWNFVGRTHEEVERARADWQRTIEGAAPDDPFGLPDGEPEPPLPAPVLPLTRLVPRAQPGAPAGSIVSKGAAMVQDPSTVPEPQRADTGASAEVRVVHQPEQRRYAVTVGGELAGFTEYLPRDAGQRLLFVHTETFPQFAGQGLASRLVSEALAEVRGSGKRIVPLCPYVAAWLRKHPEYDDAVDWPAE
ncbi:bifunctional pirin family protein/GNAT family N-acetyltransferase [Leucobacter sp. HNU]|uniref:bifunctional pirin family protein/GNAT family N-acetyltransferase n=1 Tax=Leucobacter sp. HNU TaxID=3236805 RepID=UPI003A7FD1D7